MALNSHRSQPSERGGIAIVIILVLLIPILLFTAWTWGTLSYSYGKGERAGYVQKISKKGWLCKTWEGELAMANLPGAMPEIFKFSIRDEATAQQVTSQAGQRVSLSYEEHRGIPTSCFGETQYFITKVSPIQDPAHDKAAVMPPAASQLQS